MRNDETKETGSELWAHSYAPAPVDRDGNVGLRPEYEACSLAAARGGGLVPVPPGTLESRPPEVQRGSERVVCV